jgi:hypothetical protein
MNQPCRHRFNATCPFVKSGVRSGPLAGGFAEACAFEVGSVLATVFADDFDAAFGRAFACALVPVLRAIPLSPALPVMQALWSPGRRMPNAPNGSNVE